MKTKIIFLTISFLTMFFVSKSKAQSNTSHEIFAIAKSDSSTIKIRWSLSDPLAWQKANQYGYTITRTTVKRDSGELSFYHQYLSIDTLIHSYFPLDSNEWASRQSDKEKMAAALMYNDTLGQFIPEYPEDLTLKDSFALAVREKNRKDNRYDFTLVVASQDFEVAKGLALGFEDSTCIFGEEYLYEINVDFDSSDIIIEPALVEIAFDSLYQFPAPKLSGFGMDSVAILKWELPSLTPYYTSYKIERRIENSDFISVTEAPFVFGSQIEDDPEFAFYKDSLDNNDIEYIYRVSGYDYFGDLGPASDTIHLVGRPARLIMNINFDYVIENDDGNVEMKWNTGLDSMGNPENKYIDLIAGYNIYKSKTIDGKYNIVNTEMLSDLDTMFIDLTPFGSGYYTLESIDTNDYQYISYPHFVQLSDSIPPAIPTGLTGSIDLGGKVVLDWENNTEPDLKGYRVYYSNHRDSSAYVQETKYAVDSSDFSFYIDPEFEMDSLFVTIIAEDYRSNYSDFSDTLALERPDLVGPSIPVILRIYPKLIGMDIEWRLSETKDLTRHELWRTPKGKPGWENILTIDKSNIDSLGDNYLDTTKLENRIYQYRLLAYDDAGNVTPSNIIEARPLINMERGAIRNLKGLYYCNKNEQTANAIGLIITALDSVLTIYEHTGYIDNSIIVTLYLYGYITAQQANEYQAMPDSELAQILYNLRDDLVALANQETLCGAILGWDYDAEELEGLTFKIFRGVLQSGNASSPQSSATLFKTIKASDAFLTDYQPPAGFNIQFVDYSASGGSEGAYVPRFIFIDNSAEPRFKYIYKVMASWKDGGYTKLCDAVIVDISPNNNANTGQNLGN